MRRATSLIAALLIALLGANLAALTGGESPRTATAAPLGPLVGSLGDSAWG